MFKWVFGGFDLETEQNLLSSSFILTNQITPSILTIIIKNGEVNV